MASAPPERACVLARVCSYSCSCTKHHRRSDHSSGHASASEVALAGLLLLPPRPALRVALAGSSRVVGRTLVPRTLHRALRAALAGSSQAADRSLVVVANMEPLPVASP